MRRGVLSADSAGERRLQLHKLGAFGAELTALAAFFDRPWDQPSVQLAAADQAWILNSAGFVLRALGRLPEAVQPMRAALKLGVAQENWKNAAIRAGNLSELNLTLGEVASAVQDGEESVELADRSGDAGWRMISRPCSLSRVEASSGACRVSWSQKRSDACLPAATQPPPRASGITWSRWSLAISIGGLVS